VVEPVELTVSCWPVLGVVSLALASADDTIVESVVTIVSAVSVSVVAQPMSAIQRIERAMKGVLFVICSIPPVLNATRCPFQNSNPRHR
jgi:hypothetical protein